MLAKNFERDTNLRTEHQSQPNQAEQIPLDNGAMAAEAAPDTDGYVHKYWAVTNHHRSNNPNPKHVPADPAVGLSPAAHGQ